MERCVAIILARGGSKGIPRKNMQPVAGVPLVSRSVIAATNATRIAAVYVSTDSAEIAAEAERHGARIVNRPKDLSSDAASSESGWLHALAQIRSDFSDIDALALMQCTSPFTTSEDIDRCIERLLSQNADCAFTVFEDHSFLWKLDPDGEARGINHDESKPRQRRQDLDKTYKESGALYCVRVAPFEAAQNRFCGSLAVSVVDHPQLEIDDISDLEICDAVARLRSARASSATPQFEGIRAIVTDFDGVHTDDKVSVDQNGIESVRVSRRDGLGIERLRKAALWKLLILSKERNPVVSQRAKKLRMDCLQAQDDKVSALSQWLADANLTWKEVLFVGNDINDIPPMLQAGISVCPQDASADVLAIADWVVPVAGGKGVLRYISDSMLSQLGL